MQSRWMRVSAVMAVVLSACGMASPPGSSSEDSEIALAKAQIRSSPELRASGRTLPVPSAHYPTIASALASARPGDRVRVAAGTYAECPVLVDGVTLEGHIISGDPAVTLDGAGAGCDPCVICGDTTIVHGAAVKGFRIVNSEHLGVRLNGSRGVYMSELVIENSSGPGIRSNASSFVLEHSRLLGNEGPSVRITHGSQAILIGNDIQGLADGVRVDMGTNFGEPGWAPSQAWLADNDIHGNVGNGMYVFGRGSSVYGTGNRYETSGLSGVQVNAGATYVGRRESMTANAGDGLAVAGCDIRCTDVGCTNPVITLERSRATLDESAFDSNVGQGLSAVCNAQVAVRNSTVSHNVMRGAWASSTLEAGVSVPSTLRAERTVFASNARVAVGASEDSQLELGTIKSPGRNSFLDYGLWSIRNPSTRSVSAQLNWFGTTDASAIAASIFDCTENANHGCVTFEPFLTHAP